MLVGKTAIGEGSKADLYLGDGVSQIQNLSPAMYGDTSEEDMTITDDTSTTASAALGNVTTGKTLGAILGSLKKAISLNAAAITTLNDEDNWAELILGIQYKRINKIVLMNFNGNNNSNLVNKEWTTIATVPAEIRPSHIINFATIIGSSARYYGIGQIDPGTGYIQIFQNTNENRQYVWASLVYHIRR
jgi:hypothetical protein